MAVPAATRTFPTGEATQPAYDVGIAGAGQLARMTALAAWPLGIAVVVLGGADEPACPVAAGVVEGDWHDPDAVARLAASAAVVTLENEFVDADVLAGIEAGGRVVRPRPEALAVVQDKALQKALLTDAGLPVPRFEVIEKGTDLDAVGRDLGWPLLLKARTLGYDGYGNATCADAEEAREALPRLDRGGGVLAEAFVPFERELAVMVARRPGGEARAYPVVETIQRDHVCNEVLAPAPLSDAEAARAREVALAVAEAARGIGVTGVELFLLAGGEVLVNELAPRPHNSGHYTIEACETSQFENHLRGVLDLPLGAVEMRLPAAAMVNLLGARSGPSDPRIEGALAVPGAHVHLYGKREVRVRRKMGHVTALGGTVDEALSRARTAAAAISL